MIMAPHMPQQSTSTTSSSGNVAADSQHQQPAELPMPGGRERHGPKTTRNTIFRAGKTKAVFMPFAQPGGLMLPHTLRGKACLALNPQPTPHDANNNSLAAVYSSGGPPGSFQPLQQQQHVIHLQQQRVYQVVSAAHQSAAPVGAPASSLPMPLWAQVDNSAPQQLQQQQPQQQQPLTLVAAEGSPVQPGGVEYVATCCPSNNTAAQPPVQLVLAPAAPAAAAAPAGSQGMQDAAAAPATAPMFVLQPRPAAQPQQQVVFSQAPQTGSVGTQGGGMVLLTLQDGSVVAAQQAVQPQQQFVQVAMPQPATGLMDQGAARHGMAPPTTYIVL